MEVGELRETMLRGEQDLVRSGKGLESLVDWRLDMRNVDLSEEVKEAELSGSAGSGVVRFIEAVVGASNRR